MTVLEEINVTTEDLNLTTSVGVLACVQKLYKLMSVCNEQV